MTVRALAISVLIALSSGSLSMADDVLKTLDRSHPRLILKDADLAGLKKRIEADAALKKSFDALIKHADSVCKKPALEHKLVGPRLLQVSRECLSRIYTLGLAWRITGDAKYLDAAKANLLTVCEFPDWNPSHFLDVAEMSHAVGLGYDWLYSALDEPTRAKIRAGLIEHGMKPGVAAYGPGKSKMWWVTSDFNWNQVCNGGLLIGALAVADTDPEWARKIVPEAVASLPLAMKSYAPDGAWGEGPGYWAYATEYTVFALAALETALGTDFGLAAQAGLREAGWFPIYTTSPTGLTFNFADASENRRGNCPASFWLARKFSNDAFAADERAVMDRRPGEPLDLVWYVEPGKLNVPKLEPSRWFHGPVEVVTMRSAWDDPNALFVGVKAGFNQVNHGHLDLGTFVLDALGVRWARDLGGDDYNLPGYFSGKKQDSPRWNYYRLNSLSHNVPLINNRNQDVDAKTKFEKVKLAGDFSCAVLDLSSAYPEATSVRRGVAMIGGASVLVQDEFELANRCEVAWGMTTAAKIDVGEGGEWAVLHEGGKDLLAVVLSPKGAKFAVESAERKAPEKENKGFRRLVVRLEGQQGSVRICVWLSPAGGGIQRRQAPAFKLLAEW